MSTRRRVLIVEPSAVDSNVFSAFTGLPLLGPLYLGTILEEAGFDVRVVNEDLLGRPLGPADLDADDLLLSCLTPTVERGYELAGIFRRRNPAGRVIMGGPHVSFLTDEALEHAHHVVVGEAENVIVDLLRHGAAEGVVRGQPVRSLDDLPFLKWDLLANVERMKLQPLMFSRGCPFDCNFCSVTAMFGRGYRTMSVDRVFEELERVRMPGAFFYDDNFAANRRRTHRIVDGILAKRRGSLRWWVGQVRADVTRDEDLLEKIARSNCARVYVGFESINDRALQEMHKGQSSDDIRRSIRLFHEHRIHVHGMFVFGTDADDPGILQATGSFVRRERVDSVQYMILTPFPGTELALRLEKEQRILHRRWRYYDGMHVVFRPRNFDPYSLQTLAVESYSDFYNLLLALNDGLELGVASLARLTGRAISRLGAPTLTNAIVKVMGRKIIGNWVRSNNDYLRYLRDIARGSPAPQGL